MASVWVQFRGGPERKLAGRLSPRDAEARLGRWWQGWAAKGPHFAAVDSGCGHVQLLAGATVQGIAWVEYLSPPSAPEPGQPKRGAAAPEPAKRQGGGAG